MSSATTLAIVMLAATSAGCTGPVVRSAGRSHVQALVEVPRRACRSRDLRAQIVHQGSTGFLMGGIFVRNRSSSACRVGGMPRLEIFEPGGRSVRIEVRLTDGYHTPTTPHVRFLRARGKAAIFTAWSNYCLRPLRPPLTYRLTFPGGAGVSAKTDGATGSCFTGHTAGTVQVSVLSRPSS